MIDDGIPLPLAAPGELPAEVITTRQLTRLHTMFAKAGMSGKQERLAWATSKLDRTVTTTKTLSAAEVAFLFAELDIKIGGDA